MAAQAARAALIPLSLNPLFVYVKQSIKQEGYTLEGIRAFIVPLKRNKGLKGICIGYGSFPLLEQPFF